MPKFQEIFEIQRNKYKLLYIFIFVSWVIKERPRGILFSPNPYKTGLMREKNCSQVNYF